jgi:hypothetical protein
VSLSEARRYLIGTLLTTACRRPFDAPAGIQVGDIRSFEVSSGKFINQESPEILWALTNAIDSPSVDTQIHRRIMIVIRATDLQALCL